MSAFAPERRAAPVEPADATTNAELIGWTGREHGGDGPMPARDALTISAVYACVNLLAHTLATTPLETYRRTGGRRESYPRPQWIDQPNEDTRRIRFVATVMTSLLLDGNAYILVTRSGGEVVALDVIPAAAVEPMYVPMRNGVRRLVYQLTTGDDQGRVQVVGALDRADVLHIVGLPLTGQIKGVSPLQAAKRTFELSIGAETYGAEFFTNGAVPGAVISVPGTMTPQGLKAARQTWRTIHGGRGNRHGLAILTEDAKFEKISIAPDEAQFLQTRQFAVPDIARIYGVPPHLIADASGSTSWGSGLAVQSSAFVQFSVRAWAERIEEALTTLLGERARAAGAFVRFSLDALTRGALTERLEAYRTGLQIGVYTINEVRALEDLPPDATGYGDFAMVPTNLAMLTPEGPVPLASPPAPADDGDQVAEGEPVEGGAVPPENGEGDG
ncbi:phage portal protein [Crossiella sp. NPDC003009]